MRRGFALISVIILLTCLIPSFAEPILVEITSNTPIRKEMSYSASQLFLVTKGSKFELVNDHESWVEIRVDDDTTGFIPKKACKIIDSAANDSSAKSWQNEIPVEGSIVTFGNFPQDYLGVESSPVEWLVLSVQSNQVYLLSKKILYSCPFHSKDEIRSWKSSDLRKWLNETFLQTAFSKEEQKVLIPVQYQNSKDKVGILTKDQVRAYFGSVYLKSNTEYRIAGFLRADMTDYAIGCWYSDREATYEDYLERKSKRTKPLQQSWWICNILENNYWVDTVGSSFYSSLEFSHYPCTADNIGVRPVIMINWDKKNN